MIPPALATGLAPDDVRRLRATAEFVRDQETSVLLSRVLPGLDGPELRAVADRCRFAHAALLVFPADPPGLRAGLAACGLSDDVGSRPSVVVRDRVAARHGLDAADLDVRILRPAVHGPSGERRAVEVFALTVPPASPLSALAVHERDHDHEAHLAFDVDRPDPLVLRGLRACLARHGAVADGGGYNPHEDGTVFYFATPPGTKTDYRRMELYASGDHRDLLAEHLAERPNPERDPESAPETDQATAPETDQATALETDQATALETAPGTVLETAPGTVLETASETDTETAPESRAAETLLRLLTGAWTTQALATCAALRLPEALSPDVPLSAPQLAREVGASPEALGTLLRYLAMLGVVTEDEDGFRPTALGRLLREDAAGSMRPLAQMYGGPFYQSFAHLEHSVRTGEPGFDHLYGENHFVHFAHDPGLAATFDRSMAASSRMFDPLPSHPVVTAAAAAPGPRTVIDVAGGTGELLGRILTAHPPLRGIILERPHVVAAARDRLDSTGVGDRCAYRVGDFADVPPAGDVYLLSRVLHDWDDERCREILGHLSRAMPSHADLLVVERLLPTDATPSLATAWDLHMLCNTGGRERRADEYARLFEAAGLTLVGHRPLPLDAHVLHVRKR
ncbi:MULTISPECIES: methyltransferase [Streptomyces]|uniref:Methyltransferase n=1 Tax=Streptomyces viridochromogenes TaxID=1938 RepID=A0A0L8KDB6_STRVR|nr:MULTISPECIES: methyltransferase [Streptomyces]KOG23918.1 methyltransferase [Streptomyces viridochromogenes]